MAYRFPNPAGMDSEIDRISGEPPVWLECAADLLAEPDPGPTPWAIDGLLIRGSLAAIQGAPKVWKTWVELLLALSLVSGKPAFGRFAVAEKGPVMVVLEESGRAALHRRLGALARGSAIRSDQLGDFHFAANRRVRLDDVRWQGEILQAVDALRPVAVFFDPLARLKGPGRKENVQEEMAVLLDFMRQIRDEAPRECLVSFVHHTGHEGTHLRGSSDLESYWESKLTLRRDGEEMEFYAEHREAETSDKFKTRMAWDYTTRSLRLRLVEDERREQVRAKVDAYLDDHPDASANETFEVVGGNRKEVLAAVARWRGEKLVPGSLVPPSTIPRGNPAAGTAADPLYVVEGPAGTTQEQVVPSGQHHRSEKP